MGLAERIIDINCLIFFVTELLIHEANPNVMADSDHYYFQLWHLSSGRSSTTFQN